MSGKIAIDVEALVRWAYHDQKAHIMSGGLSGGFSPSSGGADSVIRTGRAGFGLAGGGSRYFNERLHVDASTIDEVLDMYAVDERAAFLVFFNGATASRPDWGEGGTYLVPKRDRGGRFVIANRGQVGAYCELRQVNSKVSIRQFRVDWWRWHTTLTRLAAGYMAGQYELKSYDIQGFAAPAEPWAGRLVTRGT